jgi:hypothetical protein
MAKQNTRKQTFLYPDGSSHAGSSLQTEYAKWRPIDQVVAPSLIGAFQSNFIDTQSHRPETEVPAANPLIRQLY